MFKFGTIADDDEVQYPTDDELDSDDEEGPFNKNIKQFWTEKPEKEQVAKYDPHEDTKVYLKRTNEGTLDAVIDEFRQNKKKRYEEGLEAGNYLPEDDDDDVIDAEQQKQDNVVKKETKLTGNKKWTSIEEEVTKQSLAKTLEFFKDAPDVDEQPAFSSFMEMDLSRPILRGINTFDYGEPTPIQIAAIPYGLEGRDVCGCAPTGTGKTAAFMIPVLERLSLLKSLGTPVCRVLVLSPTRELAVQIFEVTKQLSQFTKITTVLVAGRMDMKTQASHLKKKPHIIIATPGQLLGHIRNEVVSLAEIEVLILDEADRLLDENFSTQIDEIIEKCPSEDRQTMIFSATITEAVERVIARYTKDPAKIFINRDLNMSVRLQQEFVRIRENKESCREAVLAALLNRNFTHKVMIFLQTKEHCTKLHVVLGLMGLRTGELHGNCTQFQRITTLKKFKEGEINILLCTDLAARGLDIPRVKTVINFTVPNTIQDYIHRVGRTARAGKTGKAITLSGEKERKMMKEIVRRSNGVIHKRNLPPDVLEKYENRMRTMNKDVEAVLEEEKTRKEERSEQSHLGTASEERTKPKRMTPEEIKQKRMDEAKKKEQLRLQKEVAYGIREVKRAKKQGKEIIQHKGGAKKKPSGGGSGGNKNRNKKNNKKNWWDTL